MIGVGGVGVFMSCSSVAPPFSLHFASAYFEPIFNQF